MLPLLDYNNLPMWYFLSLLCDDLTDYPRTGAHLRTRVRSYAFASRQLRTKNAIVCSRFKESHGPAFNRQFSDFYSTSSGSESIKIFWLFFMQHGISWKKMFDDVRHLVWKITVGGLQLHGNIFVSLIINLLCFYRF